MKSLYVALCMLVLSFSSTQSLEPKPSIDDCKLLHDQIILTKATGDEMCKRTVSLLGKVESIISNKDFIPSSLTQELKDSGELTEGLYKMHNALTKFYNYTMETKTQAELDSYKLPKTVEEVDKETLERFGTLLEKGISLVSKYNKLIR